MLLCCYRHYQICSETLGGLLHVKQMPSTSRALAILMSVLILFECLVFASVASGWVLINLWMPLVHSKHESRFVSIEVLGVQPDVIYVIYVYNKFVLCHLFIQTGSPFVSQVIALFLPLRKTNSLNSARFLPRLNADG